MSKSEKADFKVRGMTDDQKDWLYQYAKTKLGSRSRTKAILAIIQEKMAEGQPASSNTAYQKKPLSGTTNQRERVQISLQSQDYKLLQERAKNSDSSIQYYIISLILKDLYNLDRLNGQEIEQLRISNYELHKIGVNINQIAKNLNAGSQMKVPVEALREYLKDHIEKVKLLLRDNLERY